MRIYSIKPHSKVKKVGVAKVIRQTKKLYYVETSKEDAPIFNYLTQISKADVEKGNTYFFTHGDACDKVQAILEGEIYTINEHLELLKQERGE